MADGFVTSSTWWRGRRTPHIGKQLTHQADNLDGEDRKKKDLTRNAAKKGRQRDRERSNDQKKKIDEIQIMKTVHIQSHKQTDKEKKQKRKKKEQ